MNQKDYETNLVLISALIILFFAFEKTEFLIAGLVLAFCALFIKRIAVLISWLWLKFAEISGQISSKIVFSLIFFLFLTPLAVVYRLLKKNKSIRLNKNFNDSYFVVRNHLFNKEDLEKIC